MVGVPAQTDPWWWVQEPGASGHVIDYHDLEPAECRRLLAALRAAVPTREVHDGGKPYHVHLPPDEIEEPHLKAAAIELALGELEAVADGGGEPKSETELWAQLLSEVGEALRDASPSTEKTRPDRVSVSDILDRAQAHLDAIRFATDFAHHHAATDDELNFILSVQAETALHAFWLGWRMRAIDQKPFDEAAQTGIRVRSGAKSGGEMTRSTRPETAAVLAAMDDALRAQDAANKGQNLKSAATKARRKGLGTSVEANIKLYRRHSRK